MAAKLDLRKAIVRGQMVNKTSGEPAEQLRERHSSADFDLNTEDKKLRSSK